MSGESYGSRMNDQDALMWHIERDPLLRSTMVGVMTFDRTPDRDRFDRALANLVRAVPRFRQRAEPDPLAIAPPRWEPDPWFDIDFHVAHVTAPGAGTRRDLLDLAAKLSMDSFDLARPLWRLVIVDGLADGGAAMILKLHHSVTDAVGFFRVLGNLVQVGPDDQIPVAEEVAASRRMTPAQRLLDAVGYRARRAARLGAAAGRVTALLVRAILESPVGAARGAGRMLGSAARMFRPEFTPKSSLMSGRSLNTRLDTISLPLEELKAVAKVGGGKLNDAFLSGLVGGLQRYHALHGHTPAELRVNMPINFRGDQAGSEGGNYFVPARFLLPSATSDPLARVREAGRIVEDVRSEPALQQFGRLVAALNIFPALSRPLFGAILKSVDFNASNVPGPPFRLYCAGAEIQEMFPATPLAGAAVSVSLLSYDGSVHLTINTDRAAVPDVERLVACIEASFSELLACVPAQTLLEA